MKSYIEDGCEKYKRVCICYKNKCKYYQDIDLKIFMANMPKYLKDIPKTDWSLVSIMQDVLTVMPKASAIIKRNNVKTLIHSSNIGPKCYSIETTFGRYITDTHIDALYSTEHIFSFIVKRKVFKMSSNKTKSYRVDVTDFPIVAKEWNDLSYGCDK